MVPPIYIVRALSETALLFPIAWWLWSTFTLQKLPLNSDIDSRFPRQKNLGPYLKLLGILKLENLVKLKIATLISQIRNKGHLFSELLLPASYIHLACEPQTYVCGSQANIHSHSTRYTTQDNCYRIHARTDYGKFSFKFFAFKLW